jgi:hypothetical protein
MNLAVLTKRRRSPRVGDVFAMKPPDGQFLFGRVMSLNANPLGVGDAVLIYIYAARSNDKNDVPALRVSELLVAPIMTNRQPWTLGYFEVVDERPLAPGDRLPRHCFLFQAPTPVEYRDEMGNRLPGPVPPVGFWGLHSYRTIDDEISRALGIPLPPEKS